MHLGCGAILAITLLQTYCCVYVKQFSKSVNIWPSFGQESWLSHTPAALCIGGMSC